MAKGRGRKCHTNDPFVLVTNKLLSSEAYAQLNGNSVKALMPMLYRGKKTENIHGVADFPFSYADAENHGLARATYNRTIWELVEKGFIDCVGYGGIRGCVKSPNRFKLSDRWRKFGTPDFVNLPRYSDSNLK